MGFCEIISSFVNLWKVESKYEVSLERLFKSEVSLEDYKGCLEPKVQEGGLEP